MPGDLEDKLRYREPLGMDNRLYVLNFLETKSETAEKDYKAHLALVTDRKGEFGGQIHLHGPVTQTTKMTRADNGHTHDPEAMDYLATMNFASVEAFGAYWASEEYEEIVGKGKGDGGVKSSFVLYTELRLPSREQKIDKFGSQYGNPYQPYGEDWFG